MYYYGARYYDPRTSVWQSADPILNDYLNGKRGMGGIYNPFNLGMYSYSHQNPLGISDPNGQSAEGNTLIVGGYVLRGAAAILQAANVAEDVITAGAGAVDDPVVVPGLLGADRIGAAMVTAGKAINLAETINQTKAGSKSEEGDGTVMYHYSPEAVLKGPLRADSYVTPNGKLSSDQAANNLSLKPTHVPNGTQMYVHPVKLQNGEYRPAENSLPGNVVAPDHGRPGGGIEFRTNVPKSTMPSYPAAPPSKD